jgi:hypothetical protein
MSILYLQIINLENHEIVGSYEHHELKDPSLKTELENKCKEIESQLKTENKSVKKQLPFKIDSNKTIEIYYLSSNEGYLYLSFIEINPSNSKFFKETNIFEFLENLETQNIIKFLDDNDKLSNVGLQNLRIAIDNYHNTYLNESGDTLIEDDQQTHKISIINSHINDVKNDMKENVKNMMNNMQDMNEIEGKSATIKDTSFQFQRDSKNLENKMKKAAWRNKIILIATVTIIVAFIGYMLIK